MPDNLGEKIEADIREGIKARLHNGRRTRSGCGSHNSPGSRLFFSIVLITAGVLLFLDNIGVLTVNIWAYSPLLLSFWGALVLSRPRSLWHSYWGVVLIVLGVVGLLFNLGVLHLHTRDDSWFLAILLIAFGGASLIKSLNRDADSERTPSWSETSTSRQNVLDEHSIFGSVRRRVDSPDFRGGEIHSVFGSYELDLRNVQPSGTRPLEIEAHAVFGSIKIFVPANWSVVLRAPGVFGSVEDKTVPPRTANGLINPELVITGAAVFASVEIEN